MRVATGLPTRGGTTGAAARWHPYHTLKPTPATTPTPSCSSPITPTVVPQNYIRTPVSTLVSATDNFRCLTKSNKRPGSTVLQSSTTSTTSRSNPKERQDTKRAQKEKFEHALKELAVQRLADIWKETSYVIHSTSTASTTSWPKLEPSRSNVSTRQATIPHLPSPMTPTTHSFASPQSTFSQPSVTLPSPPRRIPLRAFVHEVLRRSKTMWPALQIALCYLDAAKSKVPGAIAEAKQGEGLQAAEAELDKLFGTASADDLNGERSSVPQRSSTPQTMITSPSSTDENNSTVIHQPTPSDQSNGPCDILSIPSPAVPPAPAVAPVDANSSGSSRRTKRRRTPPVPVSPLPPRPSPLLCPRRMFVAALILAAKFTQDRVYSNRAWAKISGLDAREVGRCERALGEALEWRLWVGKGVADEPTAFLRNFLLAEEALSKGKSNALARSKSDSALLSGSHDDVLTPSWSPSDKRHGDLSSAIKRSTSLTSAALSCSPRTSTPMLSDPATLVLTPANADLDAMDLQPTPLLQHSTCSSTSSSFSIDATPTSSFFSNEFSFTPAIVNTLPTPQISSQYTPDLHFSLVDTVSYAVPHTKLASGFKTEFGLDPLTGISRGVGGTFDMGIEDIVGDV